MLQNDEELEYQINRAVRVLTRMDYWWYRHDNRSGTRDLAQRNTGGAEAPPVR